MNRPPKKFDMVAAERVHDALEAAGIVPGIGKPTPYNVLGVSVASLGPREIPIETVIAGERLDDVRTGVYVITDGRRTVRYVGSVDRKSPALKPRLQAHFQRDRRLHATWTHVGLVQLPDGLDHEQVLRCEGLVGRLLDPLDNQLLPAVPYWPPWTPRPIRLAVV